MKRNSKPEKTNEPGFVYHDTTLEDLRIIQNEGLVPQEQRQTDEDRVDDEPHTFFSVKPLGYWGPVTVRFPWPDRAEPDPYGDSTIVHGEALEMNWYTDEDIPPESIDVWSDELAAWVPIKSITFV